MDFDEKDYYDAIARAGGANNGDRDVGRAHTPGDLRERGSFQATDIARRRMASDSGRRAN